MKELLGDRRGSVVPILALLSIPVIAALGLAAEAGGWFVIDRAMQNAADSAALAASMVSPIRSI
jgi:Flp pilus assembly protein TadG